MKFGIFLVTIFASSLANAADADSDALKKPTVPKALDCSYKQYNCFPTPTGCFGPPPPPPIHLPAVPLVATNPDGNYYEAKTGKSFTVNGSEIVMAVESDANVNNDGTIPQGMTASLTETSTGLTVNTSSEKGLNLSWAVKGKHESLSIWCTFIR